MLDRWVAGERPAPPLVAVVLAMCAIAGFVAGGVLASLPAGGGSADPGPTETPGGPVAVEVNEITASCQRDSGVDEARNPVDYFPEFVLDADTQTAWQCRGESAGETLTFDLGGPVVVAELGLIPGYAKVDPTAGTDWYPRNRRLTEVLWRFDDGEPLTQTLDPDPEMREMQTVTLDEPRTTTTLILEVVTSELGGDAWNNIAVTEVMILACDQC